ncbi:MAG: hypothetical protein QM662_19695, partial [Gordonia sp. (in: high G+C Gram-positive bacteria)]
CLRGLRPRGVCAFERRSSVTPLGRYAPALRSLHRGAAQTRATYPHFELTPLVELFPLVE